MIPSMTVKQKQCQQYKIFEDQNEQLLDIKSDQTCIPLTIRLLQQSQSHESQFFNLQEGFQYLNQKISSVIIIGIITSIEQSTKRILIKITDHTGQIDGLIQKSQSQFQYKDLYDYFDRKLQRREQYLKKWQKIFIRILMIKGKLYYMVQQFYPTSYNEITQHLAQILLNKQKLTKGKLPELQQNFENEQQQEEEEEEEEVENIKKSQIPSDDFDYIIQKYDETNKQQIDYEFSNINIQQLDVEISQLQQKSILNQSQQDELDYQFLQKKQKQQAIFERLEKTIEEKINYYKDNYIITETLENSKKKIQVKMKELNQNHFKKIDFFQEVYDISPILYNSQYSKLLNQQNIKNVNQNQEQNIINSNQTNQFIPLKQINYNQERKSLSNTFDQIKNIMENYQNDNFYQAPLKLNLNQEDQQFQEVEQYDGLEWFNQN